MRAVIFEFTTPILTTLNPATELRWLFKLCGWRVPAVYNVYKNLTKILFSIYENNAASIKISLTYTSL